MINKVWSLGQLLLLFVQSCLAGFVGYLLILTAAAWQSARRTPYRWAPPNHRFLILIPAHNEEALLPDTLISLSQLDYPASFYKVHVVADNCTDRTTAVARQHGATAHERQEPERRGKGYALQWLLQRLWQQGVVHDAIVILDADTLISSNFLQVMDARLTRGERVIQAYYAVRDPERSWSISLRYTALAVLHYLRPLGRMALGGSAGLKGNGMVFAADILKRHPWSAAITEDIEFHMNLILAGERVMFAPDAVVWAEMPATLADSHTQNVRWEQGRVEMARRYVPRLLHEAQIAWSSRLKERAFLYFDAAMEHLIPPFSILAGTTGLSLAASLTLPGAKSSWFSYLKKFNILLGIASLAGQAVYLLAGLHLVRAPKKVYRALLYAPFFVLWKLWLYGRVLLGREQNGWVRTARNQPLVADQEFIINQHFTENFPAVSSQGTIQMQTSGKFLGRS